MARFAQQELRKELERYVGWMTKRDTLLSAFHTLLDVRVENLHDDFLAKVRRFIIQTDLKFTSEFDEKSLQIGS